MMVQLADVFSALAVIIAVVSTIFWMLASKKDKKEIDRLKEQIYEAESYAETWRLKYKYNRKKKKSLDEKFDEEDTLTMLKDFQQEILTMGGEVGYADGSIKKWYKEYLESK